LIPSEIPSDGFDQGDEGDEGDEGSSIVFSAKVGVLLYGGRGHAKISWDNAFIATRNPITADAGAATSLAAIAM